MKKVVSIGKHYVSDFLSTSDTIVGRKKYSLDLIMDDKIGAARLHEVAPSDSMWGKYWYRSGINKSMTSQLKEIADEISNRIRYQPDDIWLDIACNDGTMFKFIPSEFIKLGIDPAEDSFINESSKLADVVVQDYFTTESYAKTGYGDTPSKVITSIAMFYDLDNPHIFINDIKNTLHDDGVWVLQLSYTPLMIEQLAFDNICHEHVYYYSLNSLKKIFDEHGLKIVDASLNDTNGGSIRVYVQKETASPTSFGTGPLRDVCNYRVQSLLEYETNKFDISNPELWEKFMENIESLKKQTVEFIRSEKAKGKIICGYGASTKGNTLLQWFGLDNTLIDAIAERSPYKFGLKTIGTNIPILSEEDVRAMKPDYMLVLPWHFISEFVVRESEYLKSGGKFIVPCPKFEII